MKISLIILGAIFLVGAFMVVETLKRKARSGSKGGLPLNVPPAEESGPTQTGRYRVQQMLKKTEGYVAAKQSEKANGALHSDDSSGEGSDDDEGQLPDPFTPGNPKRRS